MADEGNESGIRRMDLNLYLGLPRSPRPRSLDLGSDLALSSLPLSTSSTTEESPVPVEMSSAPNPTASHAPYSPSHASMSPIPSVLPIDCIPHSESNSNHEYTPYFPSYDHFGPLYGPIPSILPESETLNEMQSPRPPIEHSPTPQGADEPNPSAGLHEPHDQPYDPRLPSYIPLDSQETSDGPLSVPPQRLLRPFVGSMYPPMSAYAPRSPSPPSSMYSPPYPSPLADFFGMRDESSSRHDLFESPEFRFRRLIDSSRRLRLRRFRSSLPYPGSERPNIGRSTSPNAEQLMHDILSSQRSAETIGRDKVPATVVPEESSEEEKEEKSKAANFECNICFDLAQEPVVTSCGHLFCWPCLYQWLHVHSDHKECPVCKGEVTDANVTPIYGRGNSELCEGKKPVQNDESNMRIPPRPHGNRLESFRQQLRPISRRFGEGLATSWRRLMNHQMQRRNRFEGHGSPGMAHIHSRQQAILTRLRRSLLSEESNGEIGADAEETRMHRERESTRIPLSSDASRSELWHQFSMYGYANDRLAALTADIGRMVSNNNRYGASTSTARPLSPEQLIPRANVASTSAADQASVSSTTAVIQGEMGFNTDISGEPNSAGSSRSYRRRGRSSTSDSLDMDGVLHACKRRRMN